MTCARRLAGTCAALALTAGAHAQIEYTQRPQERALDTDGTAVDRALVLNFTDEHSADVALRMANEVRLLPAPGRFEANYLFAASATSMCSVPFYGSIDALAMTTDSGLELAALVQGDVTTVQVPNSDLWANARDIDALTIDGVTYIGAITADGNALLTAVIGDSTLVDERYKAIGTATTRIVALDFTPESEGAEYAIAGVGGVLVVDSAGNALTPSYSPCQGVLDIVRNPDSECAGDTLLYHACWSAPPSEPLEVVWEITPSGLSLPLLSGPGRVASFATSYLEGDANGSSGPNADIVVAWATQAELLFLHGTAPTDALPFTLAPANEPWHAMLNDPGNYSPALLGARVSPADFDADTYSDVFLLDGVKSRAFMLTGRPASEPDPSPVVEAPDVLPAANPNQDMGSGPYTKDLAFTATVRKPRGWPANPNQMRIEVWERFDPYNGGLVNTAPWHCDTVGVTFGPSATTASVPYGIVDKPTSYLPIQTIYYVQVTPLLNTATHQLVGPPSSWIQSDDVGLVCWVMENEMDIYSESCNEAVTSSPSQPINPGPVIISGFQRRSSVGPFATGQVPITCTSP